MARFYKVGILLAIMSTSFVLFTVFLFGFSRSSAQGDITPPTLVTLRLEPSVIDTSSSDETILVTAEFTDDLSGFLSALIIFRPRIGTTQFREVQFYDAGTPTHGTYTGTLTLPQFSAEGRWVLTHLAMNDQVGNHVQFDDDDSDGVDQFRDYYFVNGQDNAPSVFVYLPYVQSLTE